MPTFANQLTYLSPTRAIRVRLLLTLLPLFILLCLLPQAGRAQELMTLNRAILTTYAIENTQANKNASSAGPEVTLPYDWDHIQGAYDGHASFAITFPATELNKPQALYIPRIGNVYVLRLNGVQIGHAGQMGNRYQDFSKQPHYFTIPAGLLRPHNVLEIEIGAQGGRHAGLSQINFGAADDILELYTQQHNLLTNGGLIIAAVSFVFGTLALLLWIRQRDVLFLYYAAAELLWVVSMSDSLLTHPPLPWPWWGVISFGAITYSGMLAFKFALIVAEQHHGWLKQAVNVYLMLNAPMLFLGLFGHLPWIEQLWKFSVDLLFISIIISVVRHCIFSPELEKRVLAYSLCILGAAGTRDELALVLIPFLIAPGQQHDPYAFFLWARYAWICFAIALAWIIAERMRQSSRALQTMNQTLAERLAQRENELTTAFSEQAKIERHQAMMEERLRITRDMHDGLGSQLTAALHMAGNPEVSDAVLTEQLRETLDHLKLTVDAMQDIEGDIASLLGSLRYRLGPRLTAAGISLAWSVDKLPHIASWTLQHSRDLQMILFEAFSNLIAHSGAHNASLRASHAPQSNTIEISLYDDGHGLNCNTAAPAGGRGIANMRLRAARIGAALDFDNSADGTQLRLIIDMTGASQTTHP